MSEFFRAYRAKKTSIPTYFIESTAPDNVDDTTGVPPAESEYLDPIDDSDEAVREIAKALVNGSEPNLVVMVHGFSNPEPDVLSMYTSAAQAIEGDAAIRGRQGLVCVGYRWPSEKMGQPWRGTWAALPTLPIWILFFGLALLLLAGVGFFLGSGFGSRLWCPFRFIWNAGSFHFLALFGWTVAGLMLTAFLLRTIVYFRDNYRAMNYGVPDLIQIIRAIDGEVCRQRGQGAEKNDIQLSFIGHSMGGLVVTNTIRTLSDLFATQVLSLNAYGARSSREPTPVAPSREIGNVFRLMRFVLASPDIPAETLLSNRGNFLASALLRFDEAFLFSNEGDEVLRQISTLANYFVFPSKSRNHGFRLGNVEIMSREYGLIDVPDEEFLDVLRVGNLTLRQLYQTLQNAKAQRRAAAGLQAGPALPAALQASLPRVFTYFDCTDYVEMVGSEKQGRLTFAKCLKRNNPTAKLRWWSHFHLLYAYVVHHQSPNVHGGYFQGKLSQELIYRLACLGFANTVAAYGDEGVLSSACKNKQIRVLVSPKLDALRINRGKLHETPPPQPPIIDAEVPNVVGMKSDDARAVIRAIPDLSYCKILTLFRKSNEPVQTVVSQSPVAGDRIQQGAEITLHISTGRAIILKRKKQ